MGSDHCVPCFPFIDSKATLKLNCRQVMQKLPKSDQMILVLLWHEELTLEETAQVLGCSAQEVSHRYEQIIGSVTTQLQQRSA